MARRAGCTPVWLVKVENVDLVSGASSGLVLVVSLPSVPKSLALSSLDVGRRSARPSGVLVASDVAPGANVHSLEEHALHSCWAV